MLVKCLNCAKEFNKSTSEIKRSPNHFCSKSCAASLNGKKFPKRMKIIKLCKHCGVEIPRKRTVCDKCNPSIVDWNNITLEEARSSRKYQLNSRIRDKSREIYIQSGAPQLCFICGYNKTFHVCHIKPISTFSLDTKISEINALSNIIALCPNHHWELDHGILVLPEGFQPPLSCLEDMCAMHYTKGA